MHFERPLFASEAALLWMTTAGVRVRAFISFYVSYPCAATQSHFQGHTHTHKHKERDKYNGARRKTPSPFNL